MRLIVCALETSLDSAKPCYYTISFIEKVTVLETRGGKAKLIVKRKNGVT